MMLRNKNTQHKRWTLLVFLLALSLTVWSCAGNTSDDDAGEVMEEMMDEADAEHPTDAEHHAADSTHMDSTGHSEHPAGEEHPSGSEHPGN